MNFLGKAEEIKEFLINTRRYFHQNPEIDFDLYNTNKEICKILEKEKIPYEIKAKVGIVALIKGKEEGKTVALRSDMDALPLKDKKECSYKSKIEGKMHACGHDAHMAIALGSAIILNKEKEKIKGNIKIIFEPAE